MSADVIMFDDDVIRPRRFLRGSGLTFNEFAQLRNGLILSDETVTTFVGYNSQRTEGTSTSFPGGFESNSVDENGASFGECVRYFKFFESSFSSLSTITRVDSNGTRSGSRSAVNDFNLRLVYDEGLQRFDEVETVLDRSSEVQGDLFPQGVGSELRTTTEVITPISRSEEITGTEVVESSNITTTNTVQSSLSETLSDPVVVADWLRDRNVSNPRIIFGSSSLSSISVNDGDPLTTEARYTFSSLDLTANGEWTRFGSPGNAFDRGSLDGLKLILRDTEVGISSYSQVGIDQVTQGDLQTDVTEVGIIAFPVVGHSGSYSTVAELTSNEPWRWVEREFTIFSAVFTVGQEGGAGIDLRVDNLRANRVRMRYVVEATDQDGGRNTVEVTLEVDAMSREVVSISGGSRQTFIDFIYLQQEIEQDGVLVWVNINDESEIEGCINVMWRDLSYTMAGVNGSGMATVATNWSQSAVVDYDCNPSAQLSWARESRVTEWTNYGVFVNNYQETVEVSTGGYFNSLNSGAVRREDADTTSEFGIDGVLSETIGASLQTSFREVGGTAQLTSRAADNTGDRQQVEGFNFTYNGRKLGMVVPETG